MIHPTVMYLPKKASIDPNLNLAIHNGSHPKYTATVKKDLDKIAKEAKGKNWTQTQYKTEVDNVINKHNKNLSSGKIKCK